MPHLRARWVGCRARALLAGGGPLRVLAAGRTALWLEAGREVVAVLRGAGPRGVRFLGVDPGAPWPAGTGSPDVGRAPDGALAWPTPRGPVACRWEAAPVWDPEPVPPAAAPGALQAAAARSAWRMLRSLVPHQPVLQHPAVPRLVAAAARSDPGALVEAALALVGWGDGLTPSGDDLLAGFAAAGDAAVRAIGERVLAEGRTTRLSRALLADAFAGFLLEPAMALAAAVAQGDRSGARRAVVACARVGSSTGAALAAGVLLAWQAAAARTGAGQGGQHLGVLAAEAAAPTR